MATMNISFDNARWTTIATRHVYGLLTKSGKMTGHAFPTRAAALKAAKARKQPQTVVKMTLAISRKAGK